MTLTVDLGKVINKPNLCGLSKISVHSPAIYRPCKVRLQCLNDGPPRVLWALKHWNERKPNIRQTIREEYATGDMKQYALTML